MSEKICPKCGVPVSFVEDDITYYKCGNATYPDSVDPPWLDDYSCIKLQLAAVTAERDEALKRAEIAELTLRRADAYFDNDALGTMPARTVLHTLAQIRGRAQAAWEEVHKGGDA